MSPESIALLEYHWQNFKPQESGITLKTLSLRYLNPDSKPDKPELSSNTIWLEIRRPTKLKNDYFFMREVGTFVKNLKEKFRVKGKVNLKLDAKAPGFGWGNGKFSRADVCEV